MYSEFIDKFGAKIIDDNILKRIEEISGEKPHKFLRRGIFYAHRDFEKILDMYDRGEEFYLYTGRGPSNNLHIGHIIPFEFTAYLQRIFNVKVVIQITDDEKYFTRDLDQETINQYADDNIIQIMKTGFIPEKTFIFKNMEYIGTLYHNICRIQKILKLVTVGKTFGFIGNNDQDELKMFFIIIS